MNLHKIWFDTVNQHRVPLQQIIPWITVASLALFPPNCLDQHRVDLLLNMDKTENKQILLIFVEI